MNGRYVSLTPFFSAIGFAFVRSATSCVTSTSSINVTCGAVYTLFTIAFAIALRMPLSGTRSSSRFPLTAAVAAGAAFDASGAAASCAAGLPPPFTNPSTSSFVTRPFFPVAVTSAMFTPFSRASLRTLGVANTSRLLLPASAPCAADEPPAIGVSSFAAFTFAATAPPTAHSAPVSAPPLAAFASAPAAAGAAASAVLGASPCPPAFCGTSPSTSRMAITSPTVHTVPSPTFSSTILPSTGEGTSTVDLSFCTSIRIVSSFTVSPGFTCHLTISPS
ncbi:Uncharacterised protein [Mycobacterium tuberculosis]|nr:Uncharacterised protein [Mycobacterium tuberculosis]